MIDTHIHVNDISFGPISPENIQQSPCCKKPQGKEK